MSSILIAKDPDNPTLAFSAMPENIVKVGSTYYTTYRKTVAGLMVVGMAHTSNLGGTWTDDGTILQRNGSGWEAATGSGIDTSSLFEDGGTFYLFYSITSGGIGVATAPAISGPWTKDAGNPLLTPGAGAAWDSYDVRGPCIVADGGSWVMGYSGASTTSPATTEKVGYATAAALTGPWSKAASNPVLTHGASGAWDDVVVAHPHIWFEPAGELGGVSGKWAMLYTGAAGAGGGTPGPGFPWGVGIATADDLDGPWTKHAQNPFLPPGGTGAWDEGGPFRGSIWTDEGSPYTILYAGLNAASTAYRGGVGTVEFVASTVVPVGWDVFAPDDPNGPIVVTLENAYGRSFRDELHGPGKGSFKINRYAPEVASLTERSIVKVRIPELGDDYVYAFELVDVEATLATAREKGSEELGFSGPGVLGYLDHAEMLDRAFTTGLDISDTWVEIWRTGKIPNPVGSCTVNGDATYLYVISSTTRKVYKLRQSDRVVVSTSPALWSGSDNYAGGLCEDPADPTIMWALESPWAFGGSGNTKIRKIRIADWKVLTTHDLGSAVKLTDVEADSTNLWTSKYDGPDFQKRSKSTGNVVTSYSLSYLGVAQTLCVGLSINGTGLAVWYRDKRRALIVDTSAPTVITDVIKTTGISAFGGSWRTEGGQDYFYPVTYAADLVWKYQLTTATPHDPVDGIWRLDEGTAIAIAKRLYDEWTDGARPVQPIAEVTVDFSATLDSDGNTATAADGVLEYDARIGDKGLATVLRLTRFGTTFRMSPYLVWSAYNDYGVDRSSGTFASGKVRLEKGVSIVNDVRRRVNTQRIDTYMLAGGADQKFAEAELADQPYVSEGFVSTEQTDLTALGGTAAAELEQERVRAESVALGVRWGDDEINGAYLPYVHYGPGDISRVHTGTEQYDYDEQDMQIYAIQLDENATGGWAAVAECQSGWKRTAPDVSSSGSATSGGGTGGTSTTGGGGSTSARVTLEDGDGNTASGNRVQSDDIGVFQASTGVAGFTVKKPELDELKNVDTGAKADGDTIVWDEALGAWVARSPAASGGHGFHSALHPLATITAVKDPANPTFAFDALVESITKIGDTYWATYIDNTGTTAVINLATATDRDGPWTAYAGNPIYQISDVPWDSGTTGIYSPFILQHGGFFYLYYSVVVSGGGVDASNAIGVAVATAITGPYVDSGAAILSPGAGAAWDSRRVGECDVLYHDGRFVMAYMGETSAAAYQASEKVGIATATDPLGPWTKASGNPKIDFGTSGAWDDALVADPNLVFDNGYYWIMYAGAPDSGPSSTASQGLAYALDPTGTWTRYSGNPVLAPGAGGAWDDVWVFRGALWLEDGLWGGIYTGNSGTQMRGGNFRLVIDVATGSISPSSSVVSETALGQSATAGVATTYSRGDHTHGSPTVAAIRDAGRWEPTVDGGTDTLIFDAHTVVMDWVTS